MREVKALEAAAGKLRGDSSRMNGLLAENSSQKEELSSDAASLRVEVAAALEVRLRMHRLGTVKLLGTCDRENTLNQGAAGAYRCMHEVSYAAGQLGAQHVGHASCHQGFAGS